MLFQESQRDRERSASARLVPFGAMIAVEAVIGRKDMDLDLRVMPTNEFNVAFRDPGIERAEMEQHGHTGLLVSKRCSLPAVIADRAAAGFAAASCSLSLNHDASGFQLGRSASCAPFSECTAGS